MENRIQSVIAFTDGSCSGNPGQGGWGSVLCLNDKDSKTAHIIELGGYGGEQTTNNEMEIVAVLEVFSYLEKTSKDAPTSMRLVIATDSTYVLKGVSQWMTRWEVNGWKTKSGDEVANLSLWKKLLSFKKRWSRNFEIKKVDAHSGHPANERADQIAVDFSKKRRVDLFSGSLEKSPFQINDFSLQRSNSNQRVPFKPIYLSLVHGELQEHRSWPECQNRVQGVSGAKFKKVKTKQEKDSVLKSWGIEF